MFLRESRVEYFVEPIGVRVGYVIGDAVFIQPVGVGGSGTPAVDALLREDAFGIHVFGCFVDQFHVAGIVADKGEFVVRHLHDSRVRVGNLRFALSTLGGDEDNSVGGTRTVDSGRGSVFQYGDAFDVVGVHVVHAPFDAVYEYKRGVCIESAVTTHADGGTVRTGLSRTLRHVHTCRKSREGGRDAHDGAAFRLVGKVDGRHGAGQVHFLLCAVTYHYYFIQHFRFYFHLYIEFGAPVQQKGSRLITNVTERNGRFGRSCFQGIMSAQVGQYTIGRTCFDNGNTRQGFPVLISHYSTYRYGGLCPHHIRQ